MKWDDSNIIKELNRIHEYDEFKSDDELRMIFKLHQRRRFLQFWHDGSTIANHGHFTNYGEHCVRYSHIFD